MYSTREQVSLEPIKEPITRGKPAHEKDRLRSTNQFVKRVTTKPCICEHTEIVLPAARRCFSIALMISRADGSKSVSTSDLSTILEETLKWKTKIHPPRELQLARPDIEIRIFVSCCTKLDIRWFIGIGEPMLSCLVKTIGHLGDVLMTPEFRPAKFF